MISIGNKIKLVVFPQSSRRGRGKTGHPDGIPSGYKRISFVEHHRITIFHVSISAPNRGGEQLR
jgi:hypothetical protein